MICGEEWKSLDRVQRGRETGKDRGKEKTRREEKGGTLLFAIDSEQSCFQGVDFSFDYFPLSVSLMVAGREADMISIRTQRSGPYLNT